MPIVKLRCRACDLMVLIVFGDAPLTLRRACPHCGVENHFSESNPVELCPPGPGEAFGQFLPDRRTAVGV